MMNYELKEKNKRLREIKRQRVKEIKKEHSAKLRRKDCKHKTFKLIGIVNIFRIVPDSVSPIFVCEQNGKKYMQEFDHNSRVISYFEIESLRDLRNVIYLESVNHNHKFDETVFTINSKAVFAFQISENDYFIGDTNDMKAFYKNYTTDNQSLKERIEDFCQTFN